MEEYSGAYMRLLHNVFRVNWANIVLASDTPTTPVQADRDVTRSVLSFIRNIAAVSTSEGPGYRLGCSSCRLKITRIYPDTNQAW